MRCDAAQTGEPHSIFGLGGFALTGPLTSGGQRRGYFAWLRTRVALTDELFSVIAENDRISDIWALVRAASQRGYRITQMLLIAIRARKRFERERSRRVPVDICVDGGERLSHDVFLHAATR